MITVLLFMLIVSFNILCEFELSLYMKHALQINVLSCLLLFLNIIKAAFSSGITVNMWCGPAGHRPPPPMTPLISSVCVTEEKPIIDCDELIRTRLELCIQAGYSNISCHKLPQSGVFGVLISFLCSLHTSLLSSHWIINTGHFLKFVIFVQNLVLKLELG